MKDLDCVFTSEASQPVHPHSIKSDSLNNKFADSHSSRTLIVTKSSTACLKCLQHLLLCQKTSSKQAAEMKWEPPEPEELPAQAGRVPLLHSPQNSTQHPSIQLLPPWTMQFIFSWKRLLNSSTDITAMDYKEQQTFNPKFWIKLTQFQPHRASRASRGR